MSREFGLDAGLFQQLCTEERTVDGTSCLVLEWASVASPALLGHGAKTQGSQGSEGVSPCWIQRTKLTRPAPLPEQGLNERRNSWGPIECVWKNEGANPVNLLMS